jgi:1-acyl-sn-glycerol-3-phosphate acyltransferase
MHYIEKGKHKTLMRNFYHTILINLHRIVYYVVKSRWWLRDVNSHSEEERYALANEMIIKMNKSAGTTTVGYGEENLPKEGGYLLVPNHQGKYDVCGIANTHKNPITFVMDEKRSHLILVNEILGLVQGKTIPLDDPRQALTVFTEIAEELREGRRYIIFPEGGYKENNRNIVEDFKPGSFKLALMSHVPIVPVALVDSYKVYNSDHFGPVQTYVYYLEPIYYEQYKDMKTREIAKLVEGRIKDKIKEHMEKAEQ